MRVLLYLQLKLCRLFICLTFTLISVVYSHIEHNLQHAATVMSCLFSATYVPYDFSWWASLTSCYCFFHLLFFYPFADRMDLQKIIHDALYDFILSYIPHADLRWGRVGSFVWLKFFPLNPSIMPMTYFYFDQYARWRAFVLYHWGARRFGISRKCGGKLWCRGVCWNVRGLHSWFLRYWQVNLGGCLAS